MKLKEGVEIQHVCGEFILVPTGVENVDYSKIISLNEVAAYLWEQCTGKESIDANMMAEALMEEYEVDKATALADCETVLNCWEEMGLTTE